MNDDQRAIDALLNEAVVTFHPALARALGGVYEALILQQLLYRTKDTPGEWFWHTQEQFYNETSLSDEQQLTSRRNLVRKGVLEEKKFGIPARLHFKVNRKRLVELLSEQGSGFPRNKEPGSSGTSGWESRGVKELTKDSLTTTNVVGAERPKDQKEDDLNVPNLMDDDPALSPEGRAALLLVRYTAEKASQKRLGVVGEAFTVAFGHEPEYKRLALLRSKYGVEPLARTIYSLSGKDIIGDPMDYLTATLNKKGTGPSGWTPRLAWHPAGYRSAAPDEDLTVSELWLKYPNEGGIPHVIVARKRKLERFTSSYMLFEHRAHLAYAKIARPDWVNSKPGVELVKQYRNDCRRHKIIDGVNPDQWDTYCDNYVPADIRDQVRGIDVP